MCTNVSGEDEQLSKAGVFVRYVETLPRAARKAHDMHQLLHLVEALLGEIRSIVAWDPDTHQQLFWCVFVVFVCVLVVFVCATTIYVV